MFNLGQSMQEDQRRSKTACGDTVRAVISPKRVPILKQVADVNEGGWESQCGSVLRSLLNN